MASITTQNIGAASAQTVPTNNSGASAQRAAANNVTTNQVAQVTAIAADKATISLKTKDQNRSTSIAKRPEGVFRAKEDKPDSAKADSPRASRRRDPGSLDIEA
ncbi:MAG: hypothetical protein RL417_777 [Pseudomonadota bacterium]|jgi:hypothetical protein